jgi:hypothetical protein
MNGIDEQLNRLMKSAAQAPKPGVEPACFALETRVMAGWKASLRGESGDAFVMWFRRAAIGACLLAALSLAMNYHELTGQEKSISDELALADTAVQKGLNP